MVIGICDDQKMALDYLRKLVESSLNKCMVVGFDSGRKLLEYANSENELDLVFLDIDFEDEMDGMAVAAKLKEKQIKEGAAVGSLPLIIFVTAMPERMPEAFGVCAFQFVVKPVVEEEFIQVLHRAEKEVSNIKSKRQLKHIFEMSSGGTQIRFETSKLLYVESQGRKLVFYMDDRKVDCYGRILDVIGRMGNSFCQVHRSYIVNMAYIFKYDRTEIELKNGMKIPLSKGKYKDFLDAFMIYNAGRLK